MAFIPLSDTILSLSDVILAYVYLKLDESVLSTVLWIVIILNPSVTC